MGIITGNFSPRSPRHSPRDALRVMVVEDDTVQCISLEMLVEDLGHEVTAIAQHLPAAFAVLDDPTRHIDCVLLDLMLVGTSAMPLIAELKARGTPHIVITGLDQSQVESFGIDGPVLEKPFSAEQLGLMLGCTRAA